MIRWAFIIIVIALSGCAGRPLPKYEKPLRQAPVMKVRTTAYTHTESDHRRYGSRNALGTDLRTGDINSAAADWSRFPAGTVFRITATGEIFEVDDYGWALSGTNTIDLYKPSRHAMNEWGVRRVTIEILHWGDFRESYKILKPRSKHRHVKRMVKQIEQREL
jgi:3D (Asp-Asp-Asp) domain-containing protein